MYVTNTIISKRNSASFLNRTAELLGGKKSNIAAIFAGELLPNDAHYKEKDWLNYRGYFVEFTFLFAIHTSGVADP
jgi:hypothetical protein